MRWSLLVALSMLLLAGCGGIGGSSTQPSAVETTNGHVPVSPEPIAVVSYFLRDGKVAPVQSHVPFTHAVATASLTALFSDAPDGYATEIPSGTTLKSLRIDSGVATATLAGVRTLSVPAQAQVVYTLTRFPTVNGVRLLTADGPLQLTGDSGQVLGAPATRADYEDETPRILIESPLPDATVTSPMRLTGTSNDFEATFRIELVKDGKVIAAHPVTATSGSGTRGTFDTTLAFDTSGAATLVAYELSAEDGTTQLGRVEIPVVLR